MAAWRHKMSLHRIVAYSGYSLLLSGCAALAPVDQCARFKELRAHTQYDTVYKYSQQDSKAAAIDFRALPRGRYAIARLYRLRLDHTRTTPCSHIVTHKEFYLQRVNNPRMIFEEVQEFYTEDGVLITDKTETLTAQLRTTGYYVAAVPLPIPETAPPGNYRIVSKLVLRLGKKARPVTLARSQAKFRVVPRL